MQTRNSTNSFLLPSSSKRGMRTFLFNLIKCCKVLIFVSSIGIFHFGWHIPGLIIEWEAPVSIRNFKCPSLVFTIICGSFPVRPEIENFRVFDYSGHFV